MTYDTIAFSLNYDEMISKKCTWRHLFVEVFIKSVYISCPLRKDNNHINEMNSNVNKKKTIFTAQWWRQISELLSMLEITFILTDCVFVAFIITVSTLLENYINVTSDRETYFNKWLTLKRPKYLYALHKQIIHFLNEEDTV